MLIYYLMIESTPDSSNPESKELGGAYISCWVKAATQEAALKKAKEYISDENWSFIKLEDIWVAQRQNYIDLPDSLACYDEAYETGFSAIFHTWPIDEDDNDES